MKKLLRALAIGMLVITFGLSTARSSFAEEGDPQKDKRGGFIVICTPFGCFPIPVSPTPQPNNGAANMQNNSQTQSSPQSNDSGWLSTLINWFLA